MLPKWLHLLPECYGDGRLLPVQLLLLLVGLGGALLLRPVDMPHLPRWALLRPKWLLLLRCRLGFGLLPKWLHLLRCGLDCGLLRKWRHLLSVWLPGRLLPWRMLCH